MPIVQEIDKKTLFRARPANTPLPEYKTRDENKL
jgi:hypothetical protein